MQTAHALAEPEIASEGEQDDSHSDSDDFDTSDVSPARASPAKPRRRTKEEQRERKRERDRLYRQRKREGLVTRKRVDEAAEQQEKKSRKKKRKRDDEPSPEKKKKKKKTRITKTTVIETKRSKIIEITDDTPTHSNTDDDDASDEDDVEENEEVQNCPDNCIKSDAPFYHDLEANFRRLDTAFESIMKQDEAIEKIKDIVIARMLTPYRPKAAVNRIVQIHVDGPTGVGKTALGYAIAKFLGIGEGTAYPDQYLFVSLSKFLDSCHASSITGTSAGYLGFNSKDLVDMLEGTKKLSDAVKNDEPPPFTMLHFDEADKANPAFMNGLNPFLSEGSITNMKGQNYTIPNGTVFVILWTSNYSEHFKEPLANPLKSIRKIHAMMRKSGFQDCDIARMGGDPILFKPFNSSDISEIITKKGGSRTPFHSFCLNFGNPRYLADVEENLLIKSITHAHSCKLGVRHPMNAHDLELDAFLTNALKLSRNTLPKALTSPDSLDRKLLDSPQRIKSRPVYWCSKETISDEDRETSTAAYLIKYPHINAAVAQSKSNHERFERIFRDPSIKQLWFMILEFKHNNQYFAGIHLLPLVSDNNTTANDDNEDDSDDDESMTLANVNDESPKMNILSMPTEWKERTETLEQKYNHMETEFLRLKNDHAHLKIKFENFKILATDTTTTESKQPRIAASLYSNYTYNTTRVSRET